MKSIPSKLVVYFFFEYSLFETHNAHKKLLAKLNDNFTIYGQIVFKTNIVCNNFYRLLDFNIKKITFVGGLNGLDPGKRRGTIMIFLKKISILHLTKFYTSGTSSNSL